MNPDPHSRAFARAFFFLFALAVSVGCSGSTVSPYVVGHLAPRTGPDSAAGLRAGEAVAIAVDEINVNESLRIDKHPVNVVHADTGPDTDGYAHQGTRLLAVNRVAALIGAANAAELEKLIPVVQMESHQVVLVSPSGGTVGNTNKLTFCVGIDPKERGRILGKFAAEERKLTDVAVVTDIRSPIFPAMAAAFIQEFRTVDRKIRSEFDLRERSDFADLAQRLAKAKPQAVLYSGKARDLLALRAGLQKADSAGEIALLFAGEEEEAVFKRDPEASHGVVCTTGFTEEDQSKTVQRFCDQFRTRTQQVPDATIALSYDAARILFAAARQVTQFRQEKLREKLKEVSETEGLTGPFWITSEQTARRTVYVMQMSDGKSKMIKSYVPEKK